MANAREARAVPGRKTDVNDAQWIQRLHAYGLLRASFHPDREISALRSYMRLRERHLDYAAAHIQHMQKALTHMNLQLHHVVTDITRVTGMRIIRAIVAGVRRPSVLAAISDARCKAGIDVIQASLVGNYQPEHVFTLLSMYDAYQAQLVLCDQQIAQTLIKLSQEKTSPTEPLPKPRHHTPATQRAQLRCPDHTLSTGRRRSDPDPQHRPLLGSSAGRRVRHGSEPMAYLPSFHFVAHTRARLSYQWRQDTFGPYPQDQKSSDRPPTVSCGDGRKNEHGIGGALAAALSSNR
ncbi:hypothetical protein SAMN03159453_03073 [Pseudomonas sp. NFIX28]|nr:hypothetical protein SAMN03159453_03073 [Pseudomonas sp. NFIX28]